MDRGSIFMNGRSQAVRLPQGCRFEAGVKSVSVRRVGRAVILEPISPQGWDPAYWEALEAMPPMVEEVKDVDFRITGIEAG
ncbi:MAG TPA: hypothetical protein VK188_18805 [Holophaga sp.]|nr:hypothetical protein [Holophaga sp.]